MMIHVNYRAAREFKERKRLGMTLEEYRNRPKPQPTMIHHRHKNRRCCAYCGVTLTAKLVKSKKEDNDVRTWDHVVPKSIGGVIQIPCCGWCNGKKGDSSVTDWLRSEALALRASIVAQREPDPDPMSRTVIEQLRDEDVTRLRRALEYHMS